MFFFKRQQLFSDEDAMTSLRSVCLFLAYTASKDYGVKMPRVGTEDARKALIPHPTTRRAEMYRCKNRGNQDTGRIDRTNMTGRFPIIVGQKGNYYDRQRQIRGIPAENQQVGKYDYIVSLRAGTVQETAGGLPRS